MFRATRSGGDIEVVRIHGDLTLEDKDEMDALILDAARESGIGVILDLTEVSYLDSAGIMSVIGAVHLFNEAGKSLAVVTGGSRYVTGKFAEIGLGGAIVLPIFENIDEARLAMSAARE